MERAQAGLSKFGHRGGEVPAGSHLQPWQWHDIQALGEGEGHRYNRHYGVPDADAVARRIYEPPPSRRTKMLGVDVEEAALRQNRTALHPMAVVTSDLQREKEQRVPRNADVHESVIYENVHPRGMGVSGTRAAGKVWGDASVLRQPIGTNETGDKSVFGVWSNGSDTRALAADTLQDRLLLYREGQRLLRGHDHAREEAEFLESQRLLDGQAESVQDPAGIRPRWGEFPRGRTGPNGPLLALGAGW
jgi:hypothetical protein